MTISNQSVGEYVDRTHATNEVGAFTGVLAEAHATYTGTASSTPAGRYAQQAPRRGTLSSSTARVDEH